MFVDTIYVILFLVILGLLIAIPSFIIYVLLQRTEKHTHKAAFEDFVMKTEVIHTGHKLHLTLNSLNLSFTKI